MSDNHAFMKPDYNFKDLSLLRKNALIFLALSFVSLLSYAWLYSFHDVVQETSQSNFNFLILLLLLINGFALASAYFVLHQYVIKPLKHLRQVANSISDGNISTAVKHISEDEIGSVAKSINLLTNQLRKATEFTINIGKGNFNAKLDMNVQDSVQENENLALALTNMKDRLLKVAEEEQKRNWTTEGLARFAEILRANTDLQTFANSFIIELVKYIGANQGGLFILEDQETQQALLELKACYAYDRKKYLHKTIKIGEGLVGQAYLEKETIVLTEVPHSYVNITSGLGEATPKFLLIVPLKNNDEIQGVIELASFKKMDKHVVALVEKLAESIAGSIASMKINERTKKLLIESQLQAEQLRAQEEEMRQNMEELSATQEQITRQVEETELLKKDLFSREKVVGLTSAIYEVNSHGNIVFVNEKMCQLSGYDKQELIGKEYHVLRHPDMPESLFERIGATITNGQVFRGILKNKTKTGGHYWVDATIAPVVSEEGKAEKYISTQYVFGNEALVEELFKEQNKK